MLLLPSSVVPKEFGFQKDLANFQVIHTGMLGSSLLPRPSSTRMEPIVTHSATPCNTQHSATLPAAVRDTHRNRQREDSHATLSSTRCANRAMATWPWQKVTIFLGHWTQPYFYQRFSEEEIKTSVSFSQAGGNCPVITAIIVAMKVY